MNAAIVAALVMFLAAAAHAAVPAPKLPANPTLYEISMRPFLYELGVKRLRDVPMSKFAELRDRGVHIIYMMGAWQLGPLGLQHDRTDQGLLSGFSQILPGYSPDDIIGSPFAVTDYVANAEWCSDDDIAWLRDELHMLGLQLWLDFVPNHSAIDSPWASNPDLYVRAPKGSSPDPRKYTSAGIAFGNCPNSDNPWTDVAQLNYWNPALRQLMTEKLIKIASIADGIRCDMAYLAINYVFQQTWNNQLSSWGWQKPSTEFWPDAIKAVKTKYPDVRFMAEVYDNHETELQNQGFDYTYDKSLLDVLRSGNLDNTRKYITGHAVSWLQKSAHFVENHDENRAVATMGFVKKSDIACLISHTIPGIKFHWHGQWDGLKNKLDVHLRRCAPEQVSQEAVSFYKTFTTIMNTTVFREGSWTYLNVGGTGDSWKLMAWRWTYGSEKRAVVINFGDSQGSGKVVLPDVSGSGNVDIKELWSGETYSRSAPEMRSTGLFAIVAPWSVQIFAYP